MDSFDVVTVGNATLDNFLWIHDTNKHFRLSRETGELCIKMGDKTLIDKAYFLVGGNAANVSVGLSRLGLRSAAIAEIGDDEFAKKVINTLAKEGVSEKFLKMVPNKATSFSVIINYKGDRTIFEEKVEKKHDYSFDKIQTRWIYLTSIGDNWENAYRRSLAFVREKSINLAFNPGSAQLDANIEKIKDIIEETEILFVNKEEASKICGLVAINEESFIPHLLSSLQKKGVKMAVVTDGARGAFMIDENGNLHFSKPSSATVVERTGAGDAFASGFLAAVIYGLDPEDAMRWGARNAEAVIGKIGAQEGLLKKDNI